MPKITIVNEKKEIEVPAGANLRQELRKTGSEVYAGMDRFLHCPGLGLCGTCGVLVKKGMENLSPKGLVEKVSLMKSFSPLGHETEYRLSCQCTVQGDVSVEIRPEFNWSGEVFWQKPYPNK